MEINQVLLESSIEGKEEIAGHSFKTLIFFNRRARNRKHGSSVFFSHFLLSAVWLLFLSKLASNPVPETFSLCKLFTRRKESSIHSFLSLFPSVFTLFMPVRLSVSCLSCLFSLSFCPFVLSFRIIWMKPSLRRCAGLLTRPLSLRSPKRTFSYKLSSPILICPFRIIIPTWRVCWTRASALCRPWSTGLHINNGCKQLSEYVHVDREDMREGIQKKKQRKDVWKGSEWVIIPTWRVCWTRACACHDWLDCTSTVVANSFESMFMPTEKKRKSGMWECRLKTGAGCKKEEEALGARKRKESWKWDRVAAMKDNEIWRACMEEFEKNGGYCSLSQCENWLIHWFVRSYLPLRVYRDCLVEPSFSTLSWRAQSLSVFFAFALSPSCSVPCSRECWFDKESEPLRTLIDSWIPLHARWDSRLHRRTNRLDSSITISWASS